MAGVVNCVSYIMRTASRLSVQKSWYAKSPVTTKRSGCASRMRSKTMPELSVWMHAPKARTRSDGPAGTVRTVPIRSLTRAPSTSTP